MEVKIFSGVLANRILFGQSMCGNTSLFKKIKFLLTSLTLCTLLTSHLYLSGIKTKKTLKLKYSLLMEVIILAKAEKWNFSFWKVNIQLCALKKQFSYVNSEVQLKEYKEIHK